MTDTDLLILDRGQGKTTELVKSIIAYEGPWPDGGTHGVVILADANRVTGFADTAARFGAERWKGHRDHLIIGDRRIKVVTASLLDSLRGLDRRTPVWVDDAQDFAEPIIERVPRYAGLSKIVLATVTPPRRPPSAEPAPPAYNPRLIRHQLARVDRPPVTDYRHPPTPLTGYLEGGPRG